MKNIKLFLNIIFIFICILPGHAQWKQIGLPNGYEFHSSFIDLEGDIFLEVESDIYFSNDLGKSWSKTIFNGKTTPLFYKDKFVELYNHDIAITFKNDSYLFNKVTKTWNLFVKSKYPLIKIDYYGYHWFISNDPTKNGLFVSKDTGKTYQYIATNKPFDTCASVLIDSYKDDFAIVLSRCGSNTYLYQYKNNSINFLGNKFTESFLFINPLTGTVFALNEKSNLSRSINNGVDFNEVINPGISDFNKLSTMGILDNGNLILRTNYKFLISKDDGITWIDFKEELISKAYPTSIPSSISFISSINKLIYTDNSCEFQGIYNSDDNGISWSLNNNSLFHPRIKRLFEDRNSNLYAFTCSDTTTLISKDDGLNWNKFLINYKSKQYGVRDLVLNLTGDLLAVSDRSLFKSVDSGISFINVIIPKNTFSVFPIKRIYMDPNGFIYLLSDGPFIFSKNDGKTWNTAKFGVTPI